MSDDYTDYWSKSELADESEGKIVQALASFGSDGCMYLAEVKRMPVATNPDPVNSPPHYQGGIECIEYIRQVLGEDGFRAYCLGNVIKYTHRHEYKGKPLEDLKKAQYYLNAAVSTLEVKS